jgi:hypothetical protein
MATITTRAGKGSPLTNDEVDANFTNLNTDKLETSGGSVTGNITFGDNNKAIFGAGSDLEIYHDGSFSYIKESGTGDLRIQGSTNVQIWNSALDKQAANFNAGGGQTLYYDNAAKLATSATGINVTGTVTADGLNIVEGSDPNVLIQNSVGQSTLKLTSSAASGDPLSKIEFVNTNTGSGEINAYIQGETNAGSGGRRDANIVFYTGGFANDNAANIVKRLRIADTGDIFFYEDTGTSARIVYDASTQFVVNEDSADFDFRVESDANTHMLFVDASTNRLGVNTSSPSTLVEIQNGASDTLKYGGNPRLELTLSSGANGLRITGDTTPLELKHLTNNSSVGFGSDYTTTWTAPDATVGSQAESSPQIAFTPKYWNGSASAVAWQGFIRAVQSSATSTDGYFGLGAGSATDLKFKANGSEAVFNDDSADSDFRVESDDYTHMLFVDAGNNSVGIGASNTEGDTVKIQKNVDGTNYALFLQNRTNTAASAVGIRFIATQSSVSDNQFSAIVAGNALGSGNTANDLRFFTAPNGGSATERLRLLHDGGVQFKNSTPFVINENGNDADFRVESDTNTHALFVDAGNNRVGMFEVSPESRFHVKDTLASTGVASSSSPIVIIQNERLNSGSGSAVLRFDTNEVSGTSQFQRATIGAGWDGSGNFRGFLAFATNDSANTLQERMRIDSSGKVGIGNSTPSNNHANANNLVVGNGTAGGIANYVGTGLGWYAFSRDNANNSDAFDGGISYDGSRNLMFHTNAGSERMRIDGSGTLIHKRAATFNEDGADADFRVESDANTHMFFVDAGANGIGINYASPTTLLHLGMSGSANITNNTQTKVTDFTAANRFGVSGLTNNNDGIFFGLGTEGGIPAGIGFMREASGWNTQMRFYTNNITNGPDSTVAMQEKMRIESSAIVINETGADQDFRIESDTNTHALFVEGSSGNVSIGASSPEALLHVQQNANGGRGVKIENYYGANAAAYLLLTTPDLAGTAESSASIQKNNVDGSLSISNPETNSISHTRFIQGSSERMRITSTGTLQHQNAAIFNEVGGDNDFRVESDTNTHALFVDAGNNAVHIGGSTDVDDHPLVVHANTNANAIAIRGRSDDIGEITFYENDATTKLGSLQYRNTFTRLDNRTNGATLDFATGASLTESASFSSTQNIFNDGGVDMDFRIESDTNTHMLFVDAGNSRVGISESSPEARLHVTQTPVSVWYRDTLAPVYVEHEEARIQIVAADTGGDAASLLLTTGVKNWALTTGGPDNSNEFRMGYVVASSDGNIASNSTIPNMFSISTGGNVTFNERSADADFRVESDTNTHALFVDAGNSRVGINNSAPQGDLSINGLNITVLTRAYTMSTTPVEVLLLDNQGNHPVFIRVYRTDSTSPQGSELIELYIACAGSGSNINSATLVQDDKVQNGSIHNVTFTAAVVSSNVRISVTGDDAGGEGQALYFECHHFGGTVTLL